MVGNQTGKCRLRAWTLLFDVTFLSLSSAELRCSLPPSLPPQSWEVQTGKYTISPDLGKVKCLAEMYFCTFGLAVQEKEQCRKNLASSMILSSFSRRPSKFRALFSSKNLFVQLKKNVKCWTISLSWTNSEARARNLASLERFDWSWRRLSPGTQKIQPFRINDECNAQKRALYFLRFNRGCGLSLSSYTVIRPPSGPPPDLWQHIGLALVNNS